MSPSRPPVTTSAAITSRYPFMTHCSPLGEASSSRWIAGRARPMIVESSISTNSPVHAPPSVHHGRLASVTRSVT